MKRLLLLLLAGFVSFAAFAETAAAGATAATGATTGTTATAAPAIDESLTNPLLVFMVSVIMVLLFVIIGLTRMVIGAASFRKNTDSTHNSGPSSLVMIALLLLLPVVAPAQAAGAAAAAEAVKDVPPPFPDSIGGLSMLTFSVLLGFILFELLVVILLFRSGMRLMGVYERRAAERVKKKASAPAWMEKLNASVAVEEEASILTDHEYDGIRELDNSLPPWWKYGFYLTIAFAFVYIAHYHIFKTGPSSADEYRNEMIAADKEQAEYRKNAVNLIDETNVKLLTSTDSINIGRGLFTANCKACHGEHGEGIVGPNLTDDYWLHGGDIKSVFKTIKYGVEGKPMQSWQQNFSPLELEELASFVESLRGTVKNGKAPEGDLESPSHSEKQEHDSLKNTVHDFVPKR